MSVYFYLASALRANIQDNGPNYNILDNQGAFATALEDIGHALQTWPSETHEMLDRRNWRLEQLRLPDGNLRKPRIVLNVDVTSKGNLVLEWSPSAVVMTSLAETDWLFWPHNRPDYSGMPANRIIMIHNIEMLMHKCNKRHFTKAEEYLFRSLQRLLGAITEFLGHYFDVSINHNLYLDYEKDETAHISRLTSVKIRSLTEVEKELQQHQNAKWLQETIVKIQMTPQSLLELFKTNDMSASRVSQLLRTEHGVKLGQTAVITIIKRLYNDFPDLYRQVLKDPPRELTKIPANVVNIFRERVSSEQLKKDHSRWGEWGKITKEELFTLVWSNPTTVIANDFGISDVAVGKKCRALGISKPPRGYWARHAAKNKPAR